MSSKPTTRRRILVSVATVLTAGALAVGSGASFVAQTNNPGNEYMAGTLTQANSLSGASIYNAQTLKPGDTVNGKVTITNSGSLPANLKLTESGATNGFEAGKLKITITDVTVPAAPVVVKNAVEYGTVGAVNLGSQWAAGESRSYVFSVTLDSSATNASQGALANATYTWDSTQDTTPTVVNQHF
jgi:spore coat-associated protein N